MSDLLQQLGQLFLGAVPTIVLFVLLVVAYAFLVRRPLDATLAKRRALTTGALEEARGAMSAAEAETAVFEDKLRAARAEIMAAREARLKQWSAERDRALDQARSTTQARVAAARQELEGSAAAARQQIEQGSGELAAQVMRAVLPPDVTVEVAQ